MLTLFIGNKNYSSWSMRPWLALRWGSVAFEEKVLPLGMLGYGKSKQPDILAASPSGRVPALKLENGVTLWDSLAISEWAAERAPQLWPTEAGTRGLARAAAAEMHAGFPALRREAPMNLRRRRGPRDWADDTKMDLARLDELWNALLKSSGGPFLFGRRSIADGFYAPVATRLRTYGIVLSEASMLYCEAIFADADFRAWDDAATQEPWSQADIDEI